MQVVHLYSSLVINKKSLNNFPWLLKSAECFYCTRNTWIQYIGDKCRVSIRFSVVGVHCHSLVLLPPAITKHITAKPESWLITNEALSTLKQNTINLQTNQVLHTASLLSNKALLEFFLPVHTYYTLCSCHWAAWSGQFLHKTPNSPSHCTRNGTELLSDVTKYTLKTGTASLPPDLLFISSKPKFIIQNVSLILFLCKLITTHEPRSKLMTLLSKYSLSALVCHNFQG